MNSAATSTSSCCHVLDILQILLGDLRNRDVVDIDVLLADEVEQQIERAIVNLRRPCTEKEDSSLPSLRDGLAWLLSA